MPETKPAGDTPFGPLESLVGRTFEKGNEKRKPLWIAGANRRKVFYKCNSLSLALSASATKFRAWLRGATEVTQ